MSKAKVERRWCHRLVKGRIEKQGKVLSLDAKYAEVQLYDFLLGHPNVVQRFPRKELVFYPSAKAMRTAYEREQGFRLGSS